MMLIKNSKAYNTSRLMGQAKKQLLQSPTSFAKKTLRRMLTGTLRKKARSVGKNLTLVDDLQTQYQEWIVMNEPDITELDLQRQTVDNFIKKPLISIITPVFNPPVSVLEELIKSVRSQTYSNFELCLGNFGDNQEVIELIENYSKRDSRIKNFLFKKNKGIAENSNQIFSKTKGEYIALLDHDDTLSPDALYENVKLLDQDDYDFIYSDKDKIDEKGKRFEPFFKPGWSPETMLNVNYLTHLNVIKSSIVRKVGAWDPDTDGAQDWDLFLKVVSVSKKIGHIPKVLYHWRVIATSTAFSIETKPYALEGQRKAVDKYLKKNDIPAKSYHYGAELLLKWEIPQQKTLFIIKSTSSAHLREFLSSLTAIGLRSKAEMHFVVFQSYKPNKDELTEFEIVYYNKNEYAKQLKSYLGSVNESNVLFFDDRLTFGMQKEQIDQLQGWLTVEGVLAVSPRIIGNDDCVLDCGAVVTNNGIRPLFVGSPNYHQAVIGNIEWVRDLSVLNPMVFVSNRQSLLEALGKIKAKIDDELVHTAVHLEFAKWGRLVFDPKISLVAGEHSYIDSFEYYELASALLNRNTVWQDPYMNQNLSNENPMKLARVIQDPSIDDSTIESIAVYQQEAMAHAATRNLSEKELTENYKAIQTAHKKPLKELKKALFILPDFHAIYAGLNNIFSFADYLRRENVHIIFAIMAENESMDRQRELIKAKYPELGNFAELVSVSRDNISDLPSSDLAICTQWATAYLLAIYNKTNRKCYFIQDKESSFYPKGSISALVEYTYTLGFYALANTQGLLDWYRREFKGDGLLSKSVIDLSTYILPAQPKLSVKPPYKVFFYARPNEPRNAFEIGLTGLLKLKKRLDNNVELYTAGADWDPADYEIQNSITNMGRISYDKLPGFYRSMDAGIMLMFSGHPGVVASELMASGCPVVVNQYDDITWNDLYQHEKTCLTTAPTADAISENLYRILTDNNLRTHLIPAARDKAVAFYGDYEKSCAKAIDLLKLPLNKSDLGYDKKHEVIK